MHIQLDKQSCTGCQLCFSSCVFGAICGAEYPDIDIEKCTLCGVCMDSCPSDALSLYQPQTIQTSSPVVDGDAIWVLVEIHNQTIAPVVLELIGEATRLSTQFKVSKTVCAVVMGEVDEPNGKLLTAYGADLILCIIQPSMNQLFEEHASAALTFLASTFHPSVIMVGATSFGRAVSARTASLLYTGLTADCTELRVDAVTQNLLQIRPAFSGNLMATIETPHHRPQMATIRQGVMKLIIPDYNRLMNIKQVRMENDLPMIHATMLANIAVQATQSITSSDVIVAGGKGMQQAANFQYLHQLASILGGQVAGSRVAVDNGWIGYDCQVGQTGKTVSPSLYIACGISGQIQHVAAISGAQTIIAINCDPDAPIFRYAHYGIVGKVEEILPQLIASLQQIV